MAWGSQGWNGGPEGELAEALPLLCPSPTQTARPPAMPLAFRGPFEGQDRKALEMGLLQEAGETEASASAQGQREGLPGPHPHQSCPGPSSQDTLLVSVTEPRARPDPCSPGQEGFPKQDLSAPREPASRRRTGPLEGGDTY